MIWFVYITMGFQTLVETIAVRVLGTPKKLYLSSPPIVTNPLFHYLHKKHAALVPLLASEFQAMHEDGTIFQIMERIEKNLFQ